ncbi:MAG: (d)CMP kinase [Chthonomonadales bacterium]
MKHVRIAIDGPAGAGKSTVARRVAAALGITYVDTGAMYRAIAWKGLKAGIPLSDADGFARLAEVTDISFEPKPDGTQAVLVDGADVTEAIRSVEVTQLSSPVSAIPGVRRALVRRQQQMGSQTSVVMEGRDIGTVVLPDAEVKVFLTASPAERARRRWAELRAKGVDASLDEVLAQQQERDERDSNRSHSPLTPADDAVLLDTDGLSVDEVAARIVTLARAARDCP